MEVYIAKTNIKRQKYVEIIEYTKIGMFEGVELEIKKGSDVNQVSESGNTAVCEAANRGDIAILILLVDAGADLEATDNVGMTPYDYAIYNNDFLEMANFIRLSTFKT